MAQCVGVLCAVTFLMRMRARCRAENIMRHDYALPRCARALEPTYHTRYAVYAALPLCQHGDDIFSAAMPRFHTMFADDINIIIYPRFHALLRRRYIFERRYAMPPHAMSAKRYACCRVDIDHLCWRIILPVIQRSSCCYAICYASKRYGARLLLLRRAMLRAMAITLRADMMSRVKAIRH